MKIHKNWKIKYAELKFECAMSFQIIYFSVDTQKKLQFFRLFLYADLRLQKFL